MAHPAAAEVESINTQAGVQLALQYDPRELGATEAREPDQRRKHARAEAYNGP